MSAKKKTFSRKPSAVIFDLDDTLIVSTVDYGKFKRLVIDRIVEDGEPRSDYSMEELIVPTLRRYEAALRSRGVPEFGIRKRLADLDTIMDIVELERVSETTAIPGASDILSLLRTKAVKIGVLTRGCRGYATAALQKTGMDQLVDEIECRNSTSKPKPDPESYLKLARALGVGPAETLFVGDHPMDAQCAANAGAPFVGVMTGDVSEQDLIAAGSIAVFKDVGHMRSWLEGLLSD
ncbi:MAG: HAD family hydrolase [Candidatus Thermoplasmatota archaeon]|nr:HAD family hydrolase [Candidatus Thermoplasmatota archaeon]